MRLPSFEVRSSRNVRWAKCERVPQLMVIAGPNGAGKSTLLYFLRTAYGTNNVLYIGPHRALRRQQVQQRHLYANKFLLEYMLTLNDTPGFEGVQLTTGNRDAWGYDDSVNYLKHALCQIEVDRQQAIAQLYDREGQIEREAFPDPWRPLRELTNHLLPHLQFARIDVTNKEQIRCLWKAHNQDTEIDLDDLSSGEKSIIQMFYPIIEHAVRGLLTDLKTATSSVRPEMCVIIDEPELHLHPNLQYKVLDYLRQLTTNSPVQVIVATHSPMIVEAAIFEELFLLRPAELTKPDENQLIQVADDEDRLRFLRDVFGTISNVTAMRPLVMVEGVSENEARHVTADRKLYRRLHSGFDTVSIICGGGKSECKKLLDTLNKALSTFSPHLHAIALLDRDTDDSPAGNGHIHLLPVSMIENFLLDPEAIWQALRSVEEKTPLRSVRDVEVALERLLDEQEDDEVERRTKAQFGTDYFRPCELMSLSEDLTAFIEKLRQKYAPGTVEIAQARAKEIVETLRRDNRRRATFHGKSVLHAFYKHYLHNTGMSKEIFSSLVAMDVAKSDHVKEFFDEFFDRIEELNAHSSNSQRLQPVG